MAKKGEKLSDKTKKKLSESMKGRKVSESTRKKLSLASTKNRKCSVEGCDNKHEAHGLCRSHWSKHRRATDPEYREKYRKKSRDGYYKFHEERKKQKRITGKNERIKLYQKLLDRIPDRRGFENFYFKIVNKELTINDVEMEIKNSPEFISSHPPALKLKSIYL